jgi:DNA-binding CsgD family transcriptional regulator
MSEGSRSERRRSRGRRLTDRQAAILEFVSLGLENKEIGRRLGISEQAVKEHVSTLLRILAAPNRAALADAAARMRIVGTFDLDPDWMRFLFHDAPMHIAVVTGPEHRFVAANALYRASAGGREFIGRPYGEAFPDRAESLAFLDRVYKSGERLTAEVARSFARGRQGKIEEGFVSFVLQPLPGPDGTTVGIAIFSIDVTDHVRARQRLTEIESEHLAILDTLTAGVVVLDREGNLVKANTAAHELLSLPTPPVRLTPEVAAAYRLRDPSDDRTIAFEEIPTIRAMAGERCDAVVYRVFDPKLKHDRLLRVAARPLRNDAGEVRGSVTTFSEA